MIEGAPLSRESVTWIYKNFLGRPPESDAVIAKWIVGARTTDVMVEQFIWTPEFRRHACDQAADKLRTAVARRTQNRKTLKRAALVAICLLIAGGAFVAGRSIERVSGHRLANADGFR